jgi:DNA-binding NarL/FixJ family response regulator
MRKSPIIRVLVVDDHPIVRFGLCTQINLDPEMQVVGEATDGVEAVLKARELNPDVILMDVIMPNMNGILATGQIYRENPQARILILTGFTEEENIYACIREGASGFIYKDEHPGEVSQAIKDVYNGIPRINPSVTDRILHDVHAQMQQPQTTVLTRREIEILQFIAQGIPYKEISRRTSIREATIRTHVSNILKKLNLSNRSQLVLYAMSNRFIPAEEAGEHFPSAPVGAAAGRAHPGEPR